MTSNPRRALDRWARDYGGCADFDTYIRAGGSIMAARDDIGIRVNRLSDALRALQAYPNAPQEPIAEREPTVERDSPSKRENHIPGAAIGPEALARLEADQSGEPPDPHNAQVQGANDAV